MPDDSTTYNPEKGLFLVFILSMILVYFHYEYYVQIYFFT